MWLDDQLIASHSPKPISELSPPKRSGRLYLSETYRVGAWCETF